MSTNDKLIGLVAIMVIIITFGWCAKLLLGTPFAKQVEIGTQVIKSGVSPANKDLLQQNGNY
ncbi:MAG: hypothetical protein WCV55_00210 [Candidatus Paceibacterota bacterium]